MLAFLAALLLLALGVYWRATSRDPRRIAARTLRSVVVLEPADDNGRPVGVGTGFFVAPDVIATNLHVVEGAWTISAKTVLPQTTVVIDGLLGIDRANDIALLKAKQRGQPLSLGVEQPTMGSTVYVVGNPRGLEGSFSAGVVAAVRREGAEVFIQITAPISPGSSGSPALDEDGDVVGIVAASVRGGQNLNIAIPASTLNVLLQTSGRHPAPMYEATVGSGRARQRARLRGPVKSVTFLRVEKDGSKAYANEPERLLTLDDHCPAIDEDRDKSGRTAWYKPECRYNFDLLGNLVDVTAANSTRSFLYNGGSLASYTDINDLPCVVSYPSQFVEVHKCADEPQAWGVYTKGMERTFDTTWRLIEERHEHSGHCGSLTSIYSLAYDTKGCLTRVTSSFTDCARPDPTARPGERISSVEVRQCDSYGDPIAINKRVEVQEFQTTACTYDRDAKGNWTTRSCEQTGVETEIDHREIEYFGQASELQSKAAPNETRR